MDGMVREPDRRISISGRGAGCGVGEEACPSCWLWAEWADFPHPQPMELHP